MILAQIFLAHLKKILDLKLSSGEKKVIFYCLILGGGDIIIKYKNEKKKMFKFENKKNIYTYQIEQISSNLLNGITKPKFPVMDINETILNIKVLESWLKNSNKNEVD